MGCEAGVSNLVALHVHGNRYLIRHASDLISCENQLSEISVNASIPECNVATFVGLLNTLGSPLPFQIVQMDVYVDIPY